ncbi:hypothetical protein ACFLTH_13850 [Bacteroidota bacterium]
MIFILLVFLPGIIWAQSSLDRPDIFSLENRLKFGDFLFSEEDYLRAINEYREYLRFTSNDSIRFKFAYALAEMGRTDEALDNYKGLFFSSSLSENARLEFYKVSFLNSESQKFRDLCNMEVYLPEEHKSEVNRLKLFTYLFDDSVLPDSTDFVNSFSKEDKSEVLSIYLKKKFPDYKSPEMAAIFSAIVPGAGKIYTGRLEDGITALIATGILTFLAYDNLKADHDFRGWLFAGLAALSYAGNIYGAAASAQQYNAGIRFNFENEVRVYLKNKNYFLPTDNFRHR